jgi:hypothetical protein
MIRSNIDSYLSFATLVKLAVNMAVNMGVIWASYWVQGRDVIDWGGILQ